MNNSKSDYVQRISSATPNQLNIITFELCISNIDDAIKNFNNDINIYNKHIDISLLLLKEIIISLDFKYDISKELYKIYIFINKLLIKSKIKFVQSDLVSSRDCLSTIKEAFEQIKESDNSKTVVKNASKVFAGLTYGKDGTLSEYIDNSTTKGFQA